MIFNYHLHFVTNQTLPLGNLPCTVEDKGLMAAAYRKESCSSRLMPQLAGESRVMPQQNEVSGKQSDSRDHLRVRKKVKKEVKTLQKVNLHKGSLQLLGNSMMMAH